MKFPARQLTFLLTLLLALYGSGQNTSSPTPVSHAQDPAQIIQFLTHTISWYRQLAVEQQLATQPSDLTYTRKITGLPIRRFSLLSTTPARRHNFVPGNKRNQPRNPRIPVSIKAWPRPRRRPSRSFRTRRPNSKRVAQKR